MLTLVCRVVANIFAHAQAVAPCLIFIDEVEEMLGSNRDTQTGAEQGVEIQFLKHMSLLQDSRAKVWILAATNRPWTLSQAMCRRFSEAIICPLPEQPNVLKYPLVPPSLSSEYPLVPTSSLSKYPLALPNSPPRYPLVSTSSPLKYTLVPLSSPPKYPLVLTSSLSKYPLVPPSLPPKYPETVSVRRQYCTERPEHTSHSSERASSLSGSDLQNGMPCFPAAASARL